MSYPLATQQERTEASIGSGRIERPAFPAPSVFRGNLSGKARAKRGARSCLKFESEAIWRASACHTMRRPRARGDPEPRRLSQQTFSHRAKHEGRGVWV